MGKRLVYVIFSFAMILGRRQLYTRSSTKGAGTTKASHSPEGSTLLSSLRTIFSSSTACALNRESPIPTVPLGASTGSLMRCIRSSSSAIISCMILSRIAAASVYWSFMRIAGAEACCNSLPLRALLPVIQLLPGNQLEPLAGGAWLVVGGACELSGEAPLADDDGAAIVVTGSRMRLALS